MSKIAHSLITVFTTAGLDKQAAISATIKTMVDNGVEISVAYEEVFGAGSWATIKGQAYDALRA